MRAERYPNELRPLVRACLFGTAEVADLVLLTTSRGIFRRLSAGLGRLGGWWPTVVANGWMMVLTPQGSLVADAVSALETRSSIVFLGLCGSLHGHAVGELLEPTAAVLRRLHSRTDPAPLLCPPTITATVNGMICTRREAASLHRRAGTVDLEVGHLFKCARRERKRARALLIVSDVIPTLPFFRAPESAVKRAMSALVDQVRLKILRPLVTRNPVKEWS